MNHVFVKLSCGVIMHKSMVLKGKNWRGDVCIVSVLH